MKATKGRSMTGSDFVKRADNMMTKQTQDIFNELISMGYHKIREIEHDIIDRELFCPDLPLMPYICEKHNLSIEQYVIILHDVHDHACSKAIYKKLIENQDD